jgi:protease IV
MRSFFKIFFASLLAGIVCTVLVFFLLVGYIGGIASRDIPKVHPGSVLVLDLNQHYAEQVQKNPFDAISGREDIPGLYDVIRLLAKARADKSISGLLIVANGNPNGFAASEEIRNAVLSFKSSGKFVLAHADVMSQSAYSVANAAQRLYLNPQGYLEWSGYHVTYAFLKGTLEKLEIEPQVFYAGKFKSATEPFRMDQMTPENELQTSEWLNELYASFLLQTAEARNTDTASLHRLANEALIRTAADALEYKLVDALKYDDEVKDEIKKNLGIDKYENTNFISINTYLQARDLGMAGKDKIALIYAEGDIVDGKGGEGVIASETFRTLIRKARLDKSIKAIVFRINSGGGSALASENIWRELAMAKKEKPVMVSFGDVAASGGYYISCAADSIFCHASTITGSIGVFGIIPNMEAFFKNKLGVTFDGVKTGPYADAGGIHRPLSDNEKQLIQASINLTYAQFKQRVAEGRKMDTVSVDSIAQGRIWTGKRAKQIGLVDRFGGIDEAINAAAKLARIAEFRVVEYPQPKGLIEQLFGGSAPMNYAKELEQQIGPENYQLFLQVKRIKEMTNTAQARLPFQIFFR